MILQITQEINNFNIIQILPQRNKKEAIINTFYEAEIAQKQNQIRKA